MDDLVIRRCDIECVAYLYKNGYFVSEHYKTCIYNTCISLIRNSSYKNVLNRLKFMVNYGCILDYDAVRDCAIYYGYLDCLEYFHICDFSKYACKIAARRGHIDVLKYIYNNGGPFKETLNSDDDKCYDYIQNTMLNPNNKQTKYVLIDDNVYLKRIV